MGQEHSHDRETFQKLDTDNNGSLSLKELLRMQAVDGIGHLIQNSPLLLIRFDKDGNGNINYREFSKLLEYVRCKEKEVRCRRHVMKKSLVWCSISKNSSHIYGFSRDETTPAITGKRPRDVSIDSESEQAFALAEKISRDAGDYFEKILQKPEGRKRFSNWLFKLVDVNHTKKVTVNELVLMICALRHDGITPDDLSYYPIDFAKCSDKHSKPDDRYLAKKLLEEYDVDKVNFLNARQFHVLANLVLQNYKLRQELSLTEEHFSIPGYRLKHRLGKGAKGEVRLAIELSTGKRKAIKIMRKGDVSELSRIDVEIKAMIMLKHPNVVRLESVHENDTHVFFVMDLCGGGVISDYMEFGSPISEDLARFYFKKIISAVLYCHRHGVVHRDLKLDNILLDNYANVKISDFGHAGIFRKGWDLFATPLVGGLCHLAPEQITGQPYPGEKNDAWSLGVILYILLVGHSPFESPNPQTLLDNILNLRYEIPSFVSPLARELIKSMLVVDPKLRPNAKELLENPWLKGDLGAPVLSRFSLSVPLSFCSKFSSSLEAICQVLKSLEIEPISSKSPLFDTEGLSIRCIWPTKDVRFEFRRKECLVDEEVLDFTLGGGCSRDFLLLSPLIRHEISLCLNGPLNRKNISFNTGKTSYSKSFPNSSSLSGIRLQPQIVLVEQLQDFEAENKRDSDQKKKCSDYDGECKENRKGSGEHLKDKSKESPRDREKEKDKDKCKKDKEKEISREDEREPHRENEKSRDSSSPPRCRDRDKEKPRDSSPPKSRGRDKEKLKDSSFEKEKQEGSRNRHKSKEYIRKKHKKDHSRSGGGSSETESKSSSL